MTNLTTRMMIAAATLVVAAGAASAQTMKAEIPFAFRAGGKLMAPGTYRVAEMYQYSGNPVFRIGNTEGQTILVVPGASFDAKKAWVEGGSPVLAFECVDSRCALASLWTARSTYAYGFHRPKPGKDEPVRVATVAMHIEKGE